MTELISPRWLSVLNKPPAPPAYLLPPVEVHAGEFAVVGLCDVDVERLALIDESSSVCCHLEDSFLGDLPHCLIELLQVVRNLRYILKQPGRVFQCSVTSDCPNILIYKTKFFTDR